MMEGQRAIALEHAAGEQAATGTGGSSLRDYWRLLKPNVMQLVVFSGAVGIFLAPGGIHPLIAFTAILCISAGAGAAAAINNAYDSDIDALMARTRRRPTAAGQIDPADALGLGVVLSLISVMVMALAVNWTAATLLAITIAFYVFVYTLWLKRRTPQNIVIGGAAGAFPPLIGWAAVTGSVDVLPIIMFLIIFFWTPPHFWALALDRRRDYERVAVPMLPCVVGREATLRQIVIYTLILAAVALSPVVIGEAGPLYALTALALNARFLQLVWKLWRSDSSRLAMQTFKYSIVYLFALFTGLLVDHAFAQLTPLARVWA